MIKIYATSLLLSCFVCTCAFSQKTFSANSFKLHNKPAAEFNRTNAGVSRTNAAGCDTINLPVPDNWSFKLYYSVQSGVINGFVTGANGFGDQEKAAYFDVSSSVDTYLTKVWILFGVANSNTTANLSKVVPVKVYDGTTGVPGNLLTTVNSTLSDIKSDVDGGYVTEIVFPAAITLPASKKFFVSVDVSNLTWTSSVKDSLGIISTDADEVTAGQNGFGMEKYSNQWATFADSWGADFGLYIFPFVSTNATCALALPITLRSFTGERSSAGNVLSWTTQTELNSQGFELQRSADGNNYSTLAFVKSKAVNGNSTSTLNYQFTDTRPFSSKGYYRLKQVDKDGKAAFSPVVLIKGDKPATLVLSNVYPNPAQSELNVILNAPATQKINLIITDLAGRVVMQQAKQVDAGDNNLSLNVGKLAAGSYVIKAVCNAGCETLVTKFVKQ